MQENITNTLINREKQRGLMAIDAHKNAVDYCQWFMDEANQGAQPDDIMPLIMQHTQLWGLAQAITACLDTNNKVLDEMLAEVAKRKKIPQGASAKLELLKTIYTAKLLHDIFVANTNFTDKYKDIR